MIPRDLVVVMISIVEIFGKIGFIEGYRLSNIIFELKNILMTLSNGIIIGPANIYLYLKLLHKLSLIEPSSVTLFGSLCVL